MPTVFPDLVLMLLAFAPFGWAVRLTVRCRPRFSLVNKFLGTFDVFGSPLCKWQNRRKQSLAHMNLESEHVLVWPIFASFPLADLSKTSVLAFAQVLELQAGDVMCVPSPVVLVLLHPF